MEIYSKITAGVCALFALAIAAAVGCADYYWIWNTMTYWDVATRATIIAAFSLYAIIELFIGIGMTLMAWIMDDRNCDSDDIKLAIAGIIFCGGVPGIMYLIGSIINYGGSSYSSGSYETSTGGSYDTDDSPRTRTTPKKKPPVYDRDNDPRIVSTKKKPSHRNDESDDEEEVVSTRRGRNPGKPGKPGKPASTGKRKLVY